MKTRFSIREIHIRKFMSLFWNIRKEKKVASSTMYFLNRNIEGIEKSGDQAKTILWWVIVLCAVSLQSIGNHDLKFPVFFVTLT